MAIYEMSRKEFKQESESLDSYLKRKFCDIRQEELSEYVRSVKALLPLYSGVLDAHRNSIIDEILTPASVAERARAIKQTIKLAQYFFQEGNYSAFFTILSALEEKAIIRLQKSWDQVPHKYTIWYLDQLKLCGDDSHLLKIMAKRQGPYFPYLLAIKKEYQRLLEGYQRKVEELTQCGASQSAELKAEMSQLTEYMEKIVRTLLEIQSKLSSQVPSEEANSSFIRRVKVWQTQEKQLLEANFLGRSLLLE